MTTNIPDQSHNYELSIPAGPSFGIQSGYTITGFYGLYGPGDGSTWTIANAGTILGTSNGIQLGGNGNYVPSGVVTNQTGGSIAGSHDGIYIANDTSNGIDLVVNQLTSTISGQQAGVIFTNYGTVDNGGAISATSGNGIELLKGGLVINYGTGAIQGYAGVYLGQSGTVTNAGTIIGSGLGYVVILDHGGSIDNTGTIQGAAGVYLRALGTVTNEGTITANLGVGIYLHAGGVVSNDAMIQGLAGVYLGATYASTLTNAGTINGGGDDAVKFASNALSKLIVDPGASFIGAVYGGGGTIELAAGDPATLGGFGVNITNFATLQFDANANWTVSGAYATFGVNTAIAGFDTVAGNTIDLTGFVASTETYSTNALVLGDGDGNHVTLDIQGALAFEHTFQITTANTNTYIAECFASGTHIAALNGAVPIDDLGTGDLVNAHFAGLARVEWIGRRDVDCTRHPEPRKVWPVRVTAGTFGPSQPSRDLTLSPNHAVYVNGDLIPISCLINGTSIVQIPVDEVTYFHIELAQHDLLLAEGLLAESYLDVGDRANFINGGDQLRLFPDFATTSPDVAAAWETRGCAPLIIHGPRLEAVRSWLNGMAADVPLAVAA